jgi:hypothetical protein
MPVIDCNRANLSWEEEWQDRVIFRKIFFPTTITNQPVTELANSLPQKDYLKVEVLPKVTTELLKTLRIS